MEIHGSQGVKNVYFFRKHDFWGCRETKSEFDLGSVKFGISEVDFLPFRVQKKGVIEKGWNFDEKSVLPFYGGGGTSKIRAKKVSGMGGGRLGWRSPP